MRVFYKYIFLFWVFIFLHNDNYCTNKNKLTKYFDKHKKVSLHFSGLNGLLIDSTINFYEIITKDIDYRMFHPKSKLGRKLYLEPILAFLSFSFSRKYPKTKKLSLVLRINALDNYWYSLGENIDSQYGFCGVIGIYFGPYINLIKKKNLKWNSYFIFGPVVSRLYLYTKSKDVDSFDHFDFVCNFSLLDFEIKRFGISIGYKIGFRSIPSFKKACEDPSYCSLILNNIYLNFCFNIK